MSKLAFLKKVSFLLIFLFTVKGFTQLSKTHFIPPLTSAETGNANPEDQYIYISTPSATNVAYTIMPVGLPATAYITGIVSNTNPQVISIGSGNGQLFIPSSQTSTVINNHGYIIEAENTIYVSVRMNAGGGAQAGALVSKGAAALGQIFRVGSYTNQNPQSNYLNFVSVMATEDNTAVTFSDLPPGLIIKNYSGTTPITTTLNKGESYTVATNSIDSSTNKDGLIGALVSSNKPIVVNSGSANGSFHNGGGRDYGIDQIVGLDKVGTEYIFVKGDGDNNWENVLIVAHSNNTSISINGNATTTINAGEYYLIEGNQYTNGNMYVETSEAVFAYQGVGATTSEANQGMYFVPPLSCETRGNLDNIASIQNIGSTTYTGGVSIVTKVGATVTINNTALNNFSTIGPTAVTGKPDYVTYKILGLSGNISAQSTDELYCAYFNYNGAATSGSFYSGFPTPPEINFNAIFETLGNCIPNITLEVANMANFDSIEWFFDDGSGSGFKTTGVTSKQYTPSLSGTYKLVGKLDCSGLVIESLEVPVSICPDDIDNDGIPDNIDIDNDNDGILNCTESYGNQIIDLTNTTNGNIPIGAYTFTGTSSTVGNTAAIPISGANNGVFMSETSSKNGNAESSLTYELNFNQPLNLLVDYPNSSVLGSGTTNANQEFIIRVPTTRTITLLDPDDQLLIDTNFDGVYETGITQISAFEIRFKPKSTLAFGTGTFSFSAHSINNITYIHKNLSDTASNQATFQITATCVAKDTDLDGIEDSLDLDSDNDGIPDSIENQGQFIPLSNTDIDTNGLDDIYDSTAFPIDTDNDGIPDYYDLDSDNDGIYDLTETGALGTYLSDTDNNGIIDWMGPSDTNGLVDSAETSPDSGVLAYTVNNLDSDAVFSYIDADSDGDTCPDVIEAGFSDGNTDGFLGDTANITVDSNGLVTNASDGYTLPDFNFLNTALISISTQPIDTSVCETSSTTLFVISSEAETFQWEISTDGINWNPVVDDSHYSNSKTANLNISNVPFSFNNYQYRVKLDRAGNSCGIYSESITLTVNTLPVINSPVVLIQCDDDDLATLGYSDFNLTEANAEISSNAVNETFTYYTTLEAAKIGDDTSLNYITNPTVFTNRTISNDRVWARIENSLGCSNISEIELKVSTTVIPSNLLLTFNQCDDFLDSDGNNTANNNDRDGIATFDFSSVNATLLNLIPAGQNPLPPRYFRNEADALAEINEITDISNYRNIGYPNSQTIFVRIDSNISNDCLALGGHILLTVEPLPIANPVTIARQCDDDFDGAYPFNTSQLEQDILGTQNPADFNISYFNALGTPLLYADGTTVVSPISSTFLTSSQTITIRVTNNATLAPDGPCFDETAVEFIVDKSPVANPIAPIIICDGSAGDIDDDGLYPLNTSTFASTILGLQTGMDINFTYIDESGNSVTNSTLPNPLNSESQTILVEVTNPLNTTCSASTTIELVVNPLPDFTVDSPLIICSSDPTFKITLDPIEADTTESFTYEWFYEGTPLFITTPLLENVSVEGTYSVTLTKTDGTGCSRTHDIVVNASDAAKITLDDVTIIDISNNNSVSIDTTNLGLGDYTYALGETDSNLIKYNYQTEPKFENVPAGFYTIYVKDDVCGITELDISVIGYPKFFTPNGDGYNDYWKIKGINSLIQPNSTIYIFNRYGKLLKQLFAQSIGWDGTFHGAVLPADDYWFRVQLEDGRTFSGHFSLKR